MDRQVLEALLGVPQEELQQTDPLLSGEAGSLSASLPKNPTLALIVQPDSHCGQCFPAEGLWEPGDRLVTCRGQVHEEL